MTSGQGDDTEMYRLNVDDVVVPSPQCLECEWLDRQGLTCPAFGDAPIPDDIQLNLHDHQFAYEGDSGIRFKARS